MDVDLKVGRAKWYVLGIRVFASPGVVNVEEGISYEGLEFIKRGSASSSSYEWYGCIRTSRSS